MVKTKENRKENIYLDETPSSGVSPKATIPYTVPKVAQCAGLKKRLR